MFFPDYVTEILTELRRRGYEAFAVGGCIRDSLLHRTPHDWDAATSALPEETQEIFSHAPFGVRVGNGLKHGTVTVYLLADPHTECEITTFRTEGAYTDHRRPDSVCFVRHAEEDLARRDFTVNAMAAAPAAQGLEAVFLDPFGGRADLERGIIRCVGEPRKRFEEDALRILRGVRFAARYGFTIESETARAMRECTPLLGWIAPERIGEELRGILPGDGCGAQITRFADIIAFLLPGCAAEEAQTLLGRTDDTDLRLALLLHTCTDSDAREMLMRYSFGADTADRTALLIREQNAPLDTHRARCRLAAAFGKSEAERYLRFRQALDPGEKEPENADALRALFMPGVCYNTATLAVGGRELIRDAGVRPGPAMGEMLAWLMDEVIDGRLPNTAQALLDAVRRRLL